LTWAQGAGGFWVFFNRDERLTRLPATPPTGARLGGIRYLAPADGDHGGTWIGVNHRGMAAALLNRYDDSPVDPPAAPISRGLLLRQHLDSGSGDELVTRLRSTDLGPYQPFTIVTFDPERLVRIVDWTGRDLTETQTDQPGLIRTSSGADQATADRLRRATFDSVVGNHPSAARLAEFHRSHQPDRGPFSVCMHRAEAATQSLTVIRVTRSTVTIRYHGGPPCVTPVTAVRRLTRR
jgi:uncharacterized protein with NRDE domain